MFTIEWILSSKDIDLDKEKNNKLKPSKLSFILKEGALIGWLVICAYLLVALATNSPDDPGWSHAGDVEHIENSGGFFGAWLSDILFSLFGYIAFLLPTLLALRAWNVYKTRRDNESGIDSLVFTLRILGLIMVLVSATSLASIHYSGETNDLPFGVGGILGSSVESAALAAFSDVGSTIILAAVFLFGLTVFTDLSWLGLIETIIKSLLKFNDYISRRLEARTAKKIEIAQTALAQKQRKEAQEKQAKKEFARQPLNIQSPSKKPSISDRVEKEKQISFFAESNLAVLPALGLLDKASTDNSKAFSKESLQAMSKQLELKLQDFGITAEVIEVLPGPVVTCFEIQPAAGIKASRISALSRDLARSLAVVSVRVVEVIPGKSFVGIEIPNEHREMVRLSEVLSSVVYEEAKSALTLALGNDISGQPVCADLAKMPHLLVAGTTGSGKSVGINSMLLSLLYKSTPDDVRLILIDPKMLELSVYDDIPHLLTPVVTDMKDAASSLRWCVGEMELRYKLMSALGVRNLAGYNKKVADGLMAGKPLLDPLWRADELLMSEDDSPSELKKLPYIVVVVDEFADMMMIVGKKVEQLIARIAQKARAAGIHLILATQRPSVDVITGLIKANVPSRIAFQVSSKIDSRTILDQSGAESLLGHGDLLYLPPGTGVPVRVHGAFVDDHEVHRVVADWKSRGAPEYLEDITSEIVTNNIPVPGYVNDSSDSSSQESDELYDEAVAFVIETRKASISSVQRKLRIGYNRAARLVEQMEVSGVVSEMGLNGNRDVLAPTPPRD
jgi:S-DNA-T family DNA segregation ATPase FtsK/SpoIIIE